FALTLLLVVLGIGVVRRWRWTFWLILVAFLAGLLRVPAAILQVLGVVPPARSVLVPAVSGPCRPHPIRDRTGHAGWLSPRGHLGAVLSCARIRRGACPWAGGSA